MFITDPDFCPSPIQGQKVLDPGTATLFFMSRLVIPFGQVRYRTLQYLRMFLGLLDLDPLVKGIDPNTSFSHKGVEWTEIMLAK
jgi:hypothetical protein